MGGKIKELRDAMHLSQEALGKELGLSQQAISRAEKDSHSMTLSTLLILSKHFNVSTDYLLGLSDNPHNDHTIQGVYEEIWKDYGLIKIYQLLNQNNQELVWTMIEKMVQQESLKGGPSAGDSSLR